MFVERTFVMAMGSVTGLLVATIFSSLAVGLFVALGAWACATKDYRVV